MIKQRLRNLRRRFAIRLLSRHGDRVRPVVSIVVPVYNVERYLHDCLDSLTGQTLRDIEIIVVDDCSQDGSRAIAEQYARADERIKIIAFERNLGLSAARNAGIVAATGNYLLFIDSDDMLLSTACAMTTKLLDTTGSDFAVFGYERFSAAGRKPAARWITEIHQETRCGVTAAQFPEVMANAMACSKLYRRSFWDDNHLSFPVGVQYEDQPVSTQAYALATAIDIVGKVLLQWRRRDDQSSITQQLGTADNLRHQLHSLTSSLEVLNQHGDPSLVEQRLSQYLSNDLSYIVPTAMDCTTEYWRLLVDGLRQLFSHNAFADWMWRPIPASSRIAYEFVLRDDHERLREFYARGGRNVHDFPTSIIDDKVYVELPFYGDSDIDLSRFELSPRQRRLVTSVQRVWWNDESTLSVEGWAYINNIDHERHPIETTATLVGESAQASTVRVPVALRPIHNADVTTRHRWANYESAGFRLQIPVRALLGEDLDLIWRVELDSTAGGIAASSRLAGFSRRGSAGRLLPSYFDDYTRVVANFSTAQVFEVYVQRPRLALIDLDSTDGAMRATFATGSSTWQMLRLSNGFRTVDTPVTTLRDNILRADIKLPPSPGDRINAEPSRWKVRAVDSDGRSAAIGWPTDRAIEPWTVPGLPRAYRTRAGNVGFDDAVTTIDIVDARIRDDALVLDVLVAGAPTGGAIIELTGPRAAIRTSVNLTQGNQQLIIDLEASLQGGPTLPLPLGRYVLTVAASAQPIAMTAARSLGDRTPIRFESKEVHTTIELSRRNQLVVRLSAPLREIERGRRHQRELHAWHADPTSESAGHRLR